MVNPSIPARTAHPLGDPSRDLIGVPTAHLLADAEMWRRMAAELDADPDGWTYAAASRAYVAERLRVLGEELAHRRRFKDAGGAPPWPRLPDRGAEATEIKRRLPLAEAIAKLAPVTFVRRGQELVCRCPFPDHADDDPSFNVNPAKELFHCWGCGRGGDLFTFTEQWLGLDSFHAALDVLRSLAGLPDPDALYVKVDGAVKRVR